MKLLDNQYHLFGSRLLTHLCFWMAYYIFFGLLWAKDGDYYKSFGLELVLLPLRLGASYAVIYYFIPRQLLNNQELRFLLSYLGVIIVAGFLQRILIYFYYELLFIDATVPLWQIDKLVQAMVLVNTTVLLLSAFKIFQYWRIERSQNQMEEDEYIEIRADKRTHRVRPSDILYVEGLGNYAVYYLNEGKKLTSYNSLKNIETSLPETFMRIHKSFIINKAHIASYNHENVEIKDRIIPIGKSVEVRF